MTRCHSIAQCTSPPPGVLRCPIDGGLLRDAVKSKKCGHVFGLQCVLSALLKSETCPACGAPMDAADLEPADDIRDLVLETRVQCREGESIGGGRCRWHGELREEARHAHGPECGVHMRPCPFCHTNIEAGDAFEQHKAVCDECIVICPQCSEDMPRKRLLQHQATCKASLPVPLKASNELLKKMNAAAVRATEAKTCLSETQAATQPAAELLSPAPQQRRTGDGSTGKRQGRRRRKDDRSDGPAPAPPGPIPRNLAELESRLGGAAAARSSRKAAARERTPKADAHATPPPQRAKDSAARKQLAADFTVAMDETCSATPAAHGCASAGAGPSASCRSLESDSFSPPPPVYPPSPAAAAAPASDSRRSPGDPTLRRSPAATVCPFAGLGCAAQHNAKEMLRPSTLQHHLLTMCAAYHTLQAKMVAMEAAHQQQSEEIRQLRSVLLRTANQPVPSKKQDARTPPPPRHRADESGSAEGKPSAAVAARPPPMQKPGAASGRGHAHHRLQASGKAATPSSASKRGRRRGGGLAEVSVNHS